jgi:hypothetical protein
VSAAEFSVTLKAMRQPPEFFGEEELSLIYVAKKLDDALRLEALLEQAGFDYLVEPDKYSGGVIFRSERVGAFFYVAPSNEPAAREAMHRGGFKAYDLA